MQDIADNVGQVRGRIASACARVGRSDNEVTLVAVGKTFGSNHIRLAAEAGVCDVGENYVQELAKKRDELADARIRWHFVGHLQTNKVKFIASWIYLIHSVDSIEIGKEISRQAVRAGRPIGVLVEVNTTGESTKFGVEPDEAPGLIEGLARLPFVQFQGLMTIGPFLPDPEASRPAFRALREIRNGMEKKGIQLRHLSMGMTNDFEVAVEEGATIVRIGTAIFGLRPRKHS